MDVVLPKELAYSPSLPALPECISQEIVLSPVNGATFGPSQLIQFDLTSRGYLDPNSLYLRYKYKLTQTSANEVSIIRGCPVYSYFSKLETIFGSSTIESINNYNQVTNMMINLQYDVAMKYGQQTNFGYSSTVIDMDDFDSRRCATGETNTLAGALPCIITSAEKLIPLGLMPNVRIQLTTESIANMFATGTVSGNAYVLPKEYLLSNVELCYTMIDFTGEVNEIVKGMGDPNTNQFYIKSSSFSSMGSSITGNLGAGSNVDLIFNLRLASIKSLFANFQGTTRNSIFDSVDLTSGNGEFSFNVAGTTYPSRPISTINNKAATMMELKKAVSALHATDYNFSINSNEFNSVDATTTTTLVPGKYILGVNVEKLSTNGNLMTGISTQNSPITLRINTGTATTQGYTINLHAMYDCLICVDPINRQAIVKQ